MKNEEKTPKELLELQLSEHQRELDAMKRQEVTLNGDLQDTRVRISFHANKVIEYQEALKCMES